MDAPVLPRQFRDHFEGLRATHAYQSDVERTINNTRTTLAPRRATPEQTASDIELVVAGDDSGRVIVNVGEVPAGAGVWEWLDSAVDGVRARQLGFDTPAQVELARHQGVLGAGHGMNATVFTVWYPDADNLNPLVPTTSHGRWDFHTTADRAQAAIDLGGQTGRGWDFTRFANPSALQVHQARTSHLKNDGWEDEDPARNVNIVWIPDEGANTVPPGSPHQHFFGHQLDQYDPHSELLHDPKNRGENDQTGDAGAKYHSRLIDGKQFTIDRDRARPKNVQPHKAWVPTKHGRWERWPSYADIDWSSTSSVEKMNKWKEQKLYRGGWKTKRDEIRQKYNDEEKAWMRDKAKGEELKDVKATLADIAEDFIRTFNSSHPKSGVISCYIRVRDALKRKQDAGARDNSNGNKPQRDDDAGDDGDGRERRRTNSEGDDSSSDDGGDSDGNAGG
jgi:hypothetical protein